MSGFFVVDTEFAEHSKVRKANNAAIGLWVRAGSWCIRNGSDGVVPRRVAHRLGTPIQAERLVETGLWIKVDAGYEYHDWVDFPHGALQQISSSEHANPANPQVEADLPRACEKAYNLTKEEKEDLTSARIVSLVFTKEPAKPDGFAGRDQAKCLTTTPSPPSSTKTERRAIVRRAQALADRYYDIEPLCTYPAILKIVRRVIETGRFSDEEIGKALESLAHDSITVSMNTLRIELQGRIRPGRSSRDGKIRALDSLKVPTNA